MEPASSSSKLDSFSSQYRCPGGGGSTTFYFFLCFLVGVLIVKSWTNMVKGEPQAGSLPGIVEPRFDSKF